MRTGDYETSLRALLNRIRPLEMTWGYRINLSDTKDRRDIIDRPASLVALWLQPSNSQNLMLMRLNSELSRTAVNLPELLISWKFLMAASAILSPSSGNSWVCKEICFQSSMQTRNSNEFFYNIGRFTVEFDFDWFDQEIMSPWEEQRTSHDASGDRLRPSFCDHDPQLFGQREAINQGDSNEIPLTKDK